jgi:NadR type nicotinamide-nucleotide adenylyltransferase
MQPKRIAITGPESVGKTTLAQALAAGFGTIWVPEYAREYLEHLGRPYVFEDLEIIARGQLELEERCARLAHRYLFCDTDLLVIKIWSAYKYQQTAPFILESLNNSPYDLFVLCGTDVPWEYDPLRENPGEREELYQLYKKELTDYSMPFIEVSGSLEERVKRVSLEVLRL